MHTFRAKECDYTVIKKNEPVVPPFPLIVDLQGDKIIHCASPIHGRSFIVAKSDNGNFIVSKGNGLSYSESAFLDFSKVGSDILGFLPKENALRDFEIGNEVHSLGIKTNIMEYVLQINKSITIDNREYFPYLLQYSVKCPYRICDFAFMKDKEKELALQEIHNMNGGQFKEDYLFVADRLVSNLKILHDNHVMHNAIHAQNYTWALELVDFEASRTDNFPYDNPKYEEYVSELSKGEIIQTYEVINYIAWCLSESINYGKIDNIFKKYGFDLKAHALYCGKSS